MTISQKAFNALAQAAENPVVLLCDHPNAQHEDIAELLPLGLIQPEDSSGRWFEVSPTGYDFVEQHGAEVCRWKAYVTA